MFPVKFIGNISKILLNYCDRYTVNKNYDIILEPRKDDLYICRAYVNDLRNFSNYKDFMIDEEIAKDLRDIKAKTIQEEIDMMGNIVLSGASTVSTEAKGYREIDITLIHGTNFQPCIDEKSEFLNSIWSRTGEINYTVVDNNDLIGTNRFLEIPIMNNHGDEEVLLTATSEFYFGKTFIDMSAGLVEIFHPYQTVQEDVNHRKYVMIRIRYEELNLYMLVAISV